MSNQNAQRVRRIASPSMIKQQGPLKATKSFGLKTISPSASPTQWTTEGNHRKQRSPDHLRGSPNSPGFKEKNKPIRYSPIHVPSIKRTGSYDTIAGPYLKGEWPRAEQFLLPAVPQQPYICDNKSTQTPEEWEELDRKKSHKRSSSVGTEFRVLKARLAKTKEGSKPRSSPLQANHTVTGGGGSPAVATSTTTATKAIPVYIPAKSSATTTRTRGSVEGLNQEIEKLVLSSHSGISSDHHTQEATPDGHRAPVLELLAATPGPETRNQDTQTPSGPLESSVSAAQTGCGSSDGNSSSPQQHLQVSAAELLQQQQQHSCSSSSNTSPSSLQSDSPNLPIIPVPGCHDSPRVPSLETCTGTEYFTEKDREEESPNMNSFLFVREPPDGCEKVKIVEESRRLSYELQESFPMFPVIKKPLETCRIPSKSSAFCPLFKPYVSQPELTAAIIKPTPSGGGALATLSPKLEIGAGHSGSSPVLESH